MKDYSQSGEQLKLIDIFNTIGTKYARCLEFGAMDGASLSNTKHFAVEGWSRTLWDLYSLNEDVNIERVTKDNINDLFIKYNLDTGLDLMSIDVDGNDYWIWKELKFEPRVVVIEFNSGLGDVVSKTIAYNENHEWDKTSYYGASYKALKSLGESKGYKLVAVIGCNMIFVLGTEIDSTQLSYLCEMNLRFIPGHPSDKENRKWIEV